MGDRLRDFIDEVHLEMVSISGDSGRNQSPFYVFGEKVFDTNEGVPLQVRWRKTTWEALPPEQKQSVNISGSVATFVQAVECSIWGTDYDQTVDEFNLIAKAIDQIKGSAQNVTGLNQEGFYQNQVSGEWFDASAHDTKGERLTFAYAVKLNMPETLADLVLVTSASIEVSGALADSSGSLSGSFLLAHEFTVTSASYT